MSGVPAPRWRPEGTPLRAPPAPRRFGRIKAPGYVPGDRAACGGVLDGWVARRSLAQLAAAFSSWKTPLWFHL
jgi:hypothetical protein